MAKERRVSFVPSFLRTADGTVSLSLTQCRWNYWRIFFFFFLRYLVSHFHFYGNCCDRIFRFNGKEWNWKQWKKDAQKLCGAHNCMKWITLVQTKWFMAWKVVIVYKKKKKLKSDFIGWYGDSYRKYFLFFRSFLVLIKMTSRFRRQNQNMMMWQTESNKKQKTNSVANWIFTMSADIWVDTCVSSVALSSLSHCRYNFPIIWLNVTRKYLKIINFATQFRDIYQFLICECNFDLLFNGKFRILLNWRIKYTGLRSTRIFYRRQFSLYITKFNVQLFEFNSRRVQMCNCAFNQIFLLRVFPIHFAYHFFKLLPLTDWVSGTESNGVLYFILKILIITWKEKKV